MAISSPHDVEDLEGDHEMSNTRHGSDEEVDQVRRPVRRWRTTGETVR